MRLALRWHRGHGSIEPTTGQAMIGAAFQTVLRLKMATHAVVAGNGVHNEQLIRLIERVRSRQRRMQSEHAAKIEQSLRLARHRWHQLRPERGAQLLDEPQLFAVIVPRLTTHERVTLCRVTRSYVSSLCG